jgi:4-amino-4-deoxychorismate lyase
MTFHPMSFPISLLSDEQAAANFLKSRSEVPLKVKSFYSSWLGGISKNIQWLSVPVDDHWVHRGDGIFEALRFIDKKLFLCEEHLQRLYRSAASIFLKVPVELKQLEQIIKETCQHSGLDSGMVRVFVSRGPGGFGTDPRESKQSLLYVIVMEFSPPPNNYFSDGVTVAKSQYESKHGLFAQTKSCNYLLNVLIKKEATDKGVDFCVTFDQHGFLSEAPTENIMALDFNNCLLRPQKGNLLEGTTMIRALELAQSQGFSVREAQLSYDELKKCKALMMVGTTLDVLPVRQFDEKKFSDFSVAKTLRDLLLQNQQQSPVQF